jgi:hypothetical protein
VRNRTSGAVKRGEKRPRETVFEAYVRVSHWDARGGGNEMLPTDISSIYGLVEPALLAPGQERASCWICAFLPKSTYYTKMAPILRANGKAVSASETDKIDRLVLGVDLQWKVRPSRIPQCTPSQRLARLMSCAQENQRFERLVDEERVWPKDHVLVDIIGVVHLKLPNGLQSRYAVFRMQGHHCQYITSFHEDDVCARYPSLQKQIKEWKAMTYDEFCAEFANDQKAPSLYTGLRDKDLLTDKPIVPITSPAPQVFTKEQWKRQLELKDKLAYGQVDADEPEEEDEENEGDEDDAPEIKKKKNTYDRHQQVRYFCGHWGIAKNAYRHAHCAGTKGTR